ncbi:MAG: glycosyltransferase family 39 protein [Chlamydiota bacterium]
MRSPSEYRTGRRSAILIFLLALALRSMFVVYPPRGPLFSDMREYHEKARAILEKGAYGHATRPPLYPLFLAAAYRAAGDARAPVACAQALMGAAVSLFAFGIARRLSGPRAGTVAGLLVACYPGLIVYTGLIMSENLFIFLFTGALWLLARDRAPDPGTCAAAGALLGLACLTRSVLAGFIPLAAIWLRLRGERRGGALCLVSAFILLAPWTVRNCLYYRQFVPLDTYGGYNFLIGNNPDANGRQEPALLGKLGGTYWKEWRLDRGDGAPPEIIVCPEGSAAGYRAGMRFIAAHPGGFLRLGIRKFGYLCGPEVRELSWGYSINFFGAVPRAALLPATAAIIAGFPILSLLALGGICFGGAGPREARGGWALLGIAALYFSAAHFLTFGESRFHLPLVPVLAVFAGRLACPGLRRSTVRLAAFAAVAALLLLDWSVRTGEDWGRIQTVLGPGGNTARLDY